MKNLLLFLLLGLFLPSVIASEPRAIGTDRNTPPCVAGRNSAAIGFWTWPANSTVKIYLTAGDFTVADLVAVKTAAANWTDSGLETGASVRFEVVGFTAELKTQRQEMTLVRGNTFVGKSRHLAMIEAHSLRSNKQIDYARLVVDWRVKNPEVLTNVLAHELGHSMGLLDCPKCEQGSTAMGLLSGSDESNGIDGPTTCDKSAVSTAYREAARRSGEVKAEVVDEGEEPEADDTPVVKRP